MQIRAELGNWGLKLTEEALSPVPAEWQGCRLQWEMLHAGAPSQWGAAVNPGDRRVPTHGTASTPQGGRTQGVQVQGARRTSALPLRAKAAKANLCYCLLSSHPLSFHTQNQACNCHNNKAGTEFLFWKTMNISSGIWLLQDEAILFTGRGGDYFLKMS